MCGCFCLFVLLQRAVDHCTLALQRSCFCSWRQSVDEAHAEREASANQLYHRILLLRAVCSWKRVKWHTRFTCESLEKLQILRQPNVYYDIWYSYKVSYQLIINK